MLAKKKNNNISHCDRIPSFLTAVRFLRQWLCGKAVSGFEKNIVRGTG